MSVDPLFSTIAARAPKLRTGLDIGFPDATTPTLLRERFPALWMSVAGGVLPFESNQFDVAVLNGAVLSLPLVREIHRILRPDGMLFFTVEETVRHGTGNTLSQLYGNFLKNGYDIISITRPPWWRFGRGGKTLTVCARKKNWHECRPLSKCLAGLAFVCALVGSVFGASDRDAIIQVLNMRTGTSPNVYRAAVAKLRTEADAQAADVATNSCNANALQRYIIALISQDADAPEAAHLDAATRHAWLEQGRRQMRRLAEQKNNPLAWYLLSLDANDPILLERAAEGGNVQALNAFGNLCLENGATARAFDCFSKAAAMKDANGFYNLGMCYMQGYGTDETRAKERLADFSDDSSQRKGALQRAFQCFRTAAEAGHPEAINNIGGFYRDGILGTTNAELSVRWFKKSAELGNAYGKLNYALALQRGDGVMRDERAAAMLMHEACEQGCAEAMDAYAICCHRGCGVQKDAHAAFCWFQKSAALGFPPAMENLATCYERGTGTPRDIVKSAEWRLRARAARGDADAQKWVEKEDHTCSES